MRKFSIFLVAIFLVVAVAATADQMKPTKLSSSATSHPFPGTGDVEMYYNGEPISYWTMFIEHLIAVNYDPDDAYTFGWEFDHDYEIVELDTMWFDPDDYTPDGSAAFWICPDDGGVPDMSDPWVDGTIDYSGSYYPGYAETEIENPVCVSSFTISWVIVEINAYLDFPISDDDGNSGHSWGSSDGGSTWDFAFDPLIDFVWSAWADECDSAVQSSSLGSVKALFN